MRDRLTLSMRASHLLALVFVAAALALAAIGAASGDTFYLRLGTEALIFAAIDRACAVNTPATEAPEDDYEREA